ncbi:TetR family transcriptional regulator [Niallia sp. MER 6]|uniref:TetR family transcriptional regulator n=1 Tax=Niallia sp. MER 6 TaxID=2939567 RepID=UPI0037C79AC6
MACDQLYSLHGYEGVNLKAISKLTTFTRTLIYKYYNSKEEIMLDLLVYCKIKVQRFARNLCRI